MGKVGPVTRDSVSHWWTQGDHRPGGAHGALGAGKLPTGELILILIPVEAVSPPLLENFHPHPTTYPLGRGLLHTACKLRDILESTGTAWFPSKVRYLLPGRGFILNAYILFHRSCKPWGGAEGFNSGSYLNSEIHLGQSLHCWKSERFRIQVF